MQNLKLSIIFFTFLACFKLSLILGLLSCEPGHKAFCETFTTNTSRVKKKCRCILQDDDDDDLTINGENICITNNPCKNNSTCKHLFILYNNNESMSF